MTSFDDRLEQAREAKRRANEESAQRQAEADRDREPARKKMRVVAEDFAARSDTVGLKELTVGTLVSKNYKETIRSGFLKTRTETRRASFYDETLGTGWLIPDRSLNLYSDYGQPERMFVLLRDGRWIRVGHTDARLWYGTEELRKNYVRSSLDQAVSPVMEIPEWLALDEVVAIDVTTGPVKWVDPLQIANVEDLLIKELLFAERRV